MAARLHALVPNAKDLDDAIAIDTVIKNVDRALHLGGSSGSSRMSYMEAANTRAKLWPFPREETVRLSRNLPHGSGENGSVPLPPVGAPSLGADGKDVGKINLRRASEAKPRHPG